MKSRKMCYQSNLNVYMSDRKTVVIPLLCEAVSKPTILRWLKNHFEKLFKHFLYRIRFAVMLFQLCNLAWLMILWQWHAHAPLVFIFPRAHMTVIWQLRPHTFQLRSLAWVIILWQSHTRPPLHHIGWLCVCVCVCRSECSIVAKRLSWCRWDIGWSEGVMDAEESGEFMEKAHSASYPPRGMFDWGWDRPTQPRTLSEVCSTDDEVDPLSLLPLVRCVWLMMMMMMMMRQAHSASYLASVRHVWRWWDKPTQPPWCMGVLLS